MTFKPSTLSRAILGDFSVSAFTSSHGIECNIEMLDATTHADTARRRQPGLADWKATLKGYRDTDGTATGQNLQFASSLGIAAGDVFSWAPEGFTRGNRVASGVPREDSYPIDSDVAGLVGWTLGLTGDGIVDLDGVSLADLAAITIDTTGTNVDNTASTANGGAGYLHVTAYSGFSSVTFKVQHSPDNSSWADLASFASVTAVGSQQVVVATGTTVNRHTRAFADVTGSGSVTFQMSFARR